MKKLFLLLIFLMAVPTVMSVGISPPSIEYVFQPKMSADIQFGFRNNLDREMTLIASVDGELAKYATITSEKETKLGPDGRVIVSASFSLPESIGEPGWHSFGVVATESTGSSGTVGARGQVVAPVKFFVQYPGKRLNVKLNAQDASLGGSSKLILTISNVGTENITNAKATVEIFKGTEKIGEVSKENISVSLMKTVNEELVWNAGNNEPGVYLANATLDYDAAENAYANDTFKIGTFDIGVNDYTKEVGKGAINKFFITLESRWNIQIDNVFADVKVFKGSQLVTTFSAATPILQPWEVKNITGFLDASSLENGPYGIRIDLRFSSEGKTSEKSVEGSINVVEKEVEEVKLPEEKPKETPKETAGYMQYVTSTNILIIVVVILIIINMLIFLKRKRNRYEDEI